MDKTLPPADPMPVVGLRVLDLASSFVGDVTRVRETAWEIRLATGDRMWLTSAAIFTVDHDRVTLACAAGSLDRYRYATPDNGWAASAG